MSIHLFVAAGGWDIAQLVSATRAGSNVVYSALIPWVFLAAFGMLVFEGYKVFQGSTASMTGALLRIAVAVGLLTNFHDWTGEIGNAINGTVQTIGNGGGQDQLMADYAAILQNPGKNDRSSSVPFWDFIAKAGASVGDQMMRVMLWVLGAVAYALYWLMQLLQQFLLLMTIAAAPVFIGLWMLTGTRGIGMRYFLTLMSIELWPLGWALGNIVTKQMPWGSDQHRRRVAAIGEHRVCGGWLVDHNQCGLLADIDLKSAGQRRHSCGQLGFGVHIACSECRARSSK